MEACRSDHLPVPENSVSPFPHDRNLERFRVLVENSRDLIVEVTSQGELLYLSPNVKSVLGYEANDVLHKSIFAFIHPDDLAEAHQRFTELEGWTNCRCLHQNGSWISMETSFATTAVEENKVLIARDVTERRKSEDERRRLEILLHRAQKLQVMGTLAGGIVHDLNNLLCAIGANAELARTEPGIPGNAREHMDQVLRASSRAAKLTRQILSFARLEKSERKPVALQQVVAEAVALVQSTLSTSIEIKLVTAEEPIILTGDPTQIHQVVLNLCTNSVQAIGRNGGTIEVKITTFESDELFAATLGTLRTGAYARISVRDTGSGMDDTTKARVFEPLFTTKRTDEGTGLGLAVVDEIVRSHAGAILVSSELGKGSTFDVLFPLQPVAEVHARLGVVPALKTGRVLFVDQNPVVCRTMEAIQDRLPHLVSVHTSAADALKDFHAAVEEYGLVVVDHQSRRAGDLDIIHEALRSRPETGILLVTDWQGECDPDLPELCARISKPYSAEDLRNAIADAFRSRTHF